MKVKYSIKERSKKVPLKIKIMVYLHMIWIDIKFWFTNIEHK
jgi:hypothetical protein